MTEYSAPNARAAGSSVGGAGVDAAAASAVPTRVTQQAPSRLPTMSSGTISTLLWPENAEKAKAPKASRPEPGTPSGSMTLARSTMVRQAAAASAKRLGP